MEKIPELKFHATITKKTIVKATNPLPLPDQPHIISLSNLDLLSGRFPVTYIYFFRKQNTNHTNNNIDTNLIISSLAECLNHFYPFSGKIIENPQSKEPEIICINTGALVTEADAGITLNELNFYDLDKSVKGKLVIIDLEFPVQVQITNFACGGICLSFTFDHALGDATAFAKFLMTWSELAIGKPLSCVPADHGRNLRARFPPIYDPILDQQFISCTMEEITKIPTKGILLKRLYHIDGSTIERLQKQASANGKNRTKIEAFSAYTWKIMATAMEKTNHHNCKMGWLVDGRSRISMTTNNYIGNVLSLAFEEANVNDIKACSIVDIADNIHNAISRVANEAHFRSLIDWIECKRPGLMLSKNVLGLGGPTLVILSGRRFPVLELEFGFGSPVLGTTYSTVEKLGVGYMNQRESARGDGSWCVSTILSAEMVDALESDPNQVFQRMNLNHLQNN